MHRRAAQSPLTEATERFQEASGRKYRNAITTARTFDRIMGTMAPEEITFEHMETFCGLARTQGFAELTVKRFMGDLKTIVFETTGKRLRPDQPLPVLDMPTPQDPAQMSVCRFAGKYVSDQEIIRQEPRYSAHRFARYIGNLRTGVISTDDLVTFRKAAQSQGLAPATIESTISDIMTLVKAATGTDLKPGKRLRKPRPEPAPVSLKALEGCWRHCDHWLQQWIVLSFWTCLRLSDALGLQMSLKFCPPETLQWRASKTQHWHRWPLPNWLSPWLTRRTMPFESANDWGTRILRQHIRNACKAGGVPVWTPKNLRQFALSQWMRTNAAAGQIIHGCGLNGVLKHYIDPIVILEEAAAKLPVPEFFFLDSAPKPVAATDPAALFNELDETTRNAVLQMVMALKGKTA